jgi:hypothetical protein
MWVFGRLHLLKHIIALILYPWICYMKGNWLIMSTEKRRSLKRPYFHQHRYLDWKYIKTSKKNWTIFAGLQNLEMSRRGAFSTLQVKRVSCRLAGIYIPLQQYVSLLLAWKRHNKVCTFFKMFVVSVILESLNVGVIIDGPTFLPSWFKIGLLV